MTTVIDGLRQILGTPTFASDNIAGMLEYMFAGVILCIVVSSVFRFISRWFGL